MKSDFIKLNILEYVSPTTYWSPGREPYFLNNNEHIIVRLSTIDEIAHADSSLKVFNSENEHEDYIKVKTEVLKEHAGPNVSDYDIQAMCEKEHTYARCYKITTSTQHSQGINGFNSTFYITKESCEKLLEAIGFEEGI